MPGPSSTLDELRSAMLSSSSASPTSPSSGASREPDAFVAALSDALHYILLHRWTSRDDRAAFVHARAIGPFTQREPIILDGRKPTPFHCTKQPVIPLVDYIVRLVRYVGCSVECFVIALILIDRHVAATGVPIEVSNAYRLLSLALGIAAKSRDDKFYSNKFYAQVAGIAPREWNRLEIELLYTLSWNLFTTPEEYHLEEAALIGCVQGCRSLYVSPLMPLHGGGAAAGGSLDDLLSPSFAVSSPPSLTLQQHSRAQPPMPSLASPPAASSSSGLVFRSRKLSSSSSLSELHAHQQHPPFGHSAASHLSHSQYLLQHGTLGSGGVIRAAEHPAPPPSLQLRTSMSMNSLASSVAGEQDLSEMSTHTPRSATLSAAGNAPVFHTPPSHHYHHQHHHNRDGFGLPAFGAQTASATLRFNGAAAAAADSCSSAGVSPLQQAHHSHHVASHGSPNSTGAATSLAQALAAAGVGSPTMMHGSPHAAGSSAAHAAPPSRRPSGGPSHMPPRSGSQWTIATTGGVSSTCSSHTSSPPVWPASAVGGWATTASPPPGVNPVQQQPQQHQGSDGS